MTEVWRLRGDGWGGAPGRKAPRPWKAPYRQHGRHLPLLKEMELTGRVEGDGEEALSGLRMGGDRAGCFGSSSRCPPVLFTQDLLRDRRAGGLEALLGWNCPSERGQQPPDPC